MTTDELSVLGDKTFGFMASDITGVVMNSINSYYQEVFDAQKFIERKDEIGNLTYEPCSINNPDGKTMTYQDLEPHQLYNRKLSFDCLHEIISKSKPSIEHQEVMKSKWFEMKHPTVTFSSMENAVALHSTKIGNSKKKTENELQTEQVSKMSLFKSLKQKNKNQSL